MAKLGSLEGRVNVTPAAAAPAPAEPAAKPVAAVPDITSTSAPNYETFERGESRLTREQGNQLNDLAKDLSAARTDKKNPATPAITKNTLLRVGARVLLDYADRLEGQTEDQLVESLKRALR